MDNPRMINVAKAKELLGLEDEDIAEIEAIMRKGGADTVQDVMKEPLFDISMGVLGLGRQQRGLVEEMMKAACTVAFMNGMLSFMGLAELVKKRAAERGHVIKPAPAPTADGGTSVH